MSDTEREPVLDPRGPQPRHRLTLAPRIPLAELRERRILFFNNTKLDYCTYPAIFPRLKALLREKGIERFIDVRETVRGKTMADLRQFAQRLVSTGADAAIVGIADIGVTPASTILTVVLEELGIPTVLLTAGPGRDLAKAVAYYRAGRLGLCPLDLYQGSTEAEVVSEVDRCFPQLLRLLTDPAERLAEACAVGFPLDREPPSADGLLLLPGLFAGAGPSDALDAITDQFQVLHLGDGLPFMPPTRGRLARMLAHCPWDPDEVLIAETGPAGTDIRVRDLAVQAVMAGCRSEHLPILVTAFRAMGDPRYNFLQSVTTSHPGGNLILVSGPLTAPLSIHGGQGCLGPGFPANAAIGRAVNLVLINRCRVVPGFSDLDCLSSQAQFTYCFAEDPGLSPWSVIHQERFDAGTTAVYVLKAEPPHDVIDFLSTTGASLLETIVGSCTTLGSNNAYITGNLIVVLTPDHARLMHRDGFTKQVLRERIHRETHHPAARVANRGLSPVRPKGFGEMDPIPVSRSPEDIEIVVAGGHGGHSAVILPWALHSEAIVEPVRLPNGRIARGIDEFRVE